MGKNPVPRWSWFEQDVVGVIAECEFARAFGLDVAPIYAAEHGVPDFRLGRWRVEVKAFAFDQTRPTRRSSLAVRVEHYKDNPSDIYVLWSVNPRNGETFPLGWATSYDFATLGRVGKLSEETGYINWIIPSHRLRRFDELRGYLMRLRELRTLDDGRTLAIDWWVSRQSAAVSIDDATKAYIYRVHRPEGETWCVCGLGEQNPVGAYQSYKEGVRAALSIVEPGRDWAMALP